MPWLDDEPPSDDTTRVWHTAFKNALRRRIQRQKIVPVLQELSQKHEASPRDIARVLLTFRAPPTHNGGDDPLLFAYADELLRIRAITVDSLLIELLETSRFVGKAVSAQQQAPRIGMPTIEERLLNLLTQLYVGGVLQIQLQDAHGLIFALARWFHVVAEYEMGKQLEAGASHNLDIFAFKTYEAIASLAITVLGSRALQDVTKPSWWKKRRPLVVSEMESFDKHVLQWMHSQHAGHLRVLTTQRPYLETDKNGRPVLSDEQVMQSISHISFVNTRAGLYIWLESRVSARPLTDDMTMSAYMQARYHRDNQSMAVALLQASFDVLTNVLVRKEPDHNVKVVRSFICNKVPVLLNMMGAFVEPPASIETCIQVAFDSITMEAVPPITAGSAEVRDKLKLARQEFLQSATLLGLLTEDTMSGILLDASVGVPKVARYTKDALVAQCSNNASRLEQLLGELEGMVGNAGAISACIVETIGNLCANKDTMALKSVCNMLIKRLPTVDIILQYTQAANLLVPLCTQLNEWTHDPEQTEFAPGYEEFAAILVLVLAVRHRYGLSRADLGLLTDDNFVARLVQGISVSKKPNDLTPEQSDQLSRWVDALYAVDDSGENNGISDDVMRPCPPQDFYRLVPTLFEQSVLACKSNILPLKAFKGGLELLLEPFLLPCLVGGLSWLVQHSWEDHGDADVLLQALEKLLRQNSTSQEAKSMHRAILCIVADPLCRTLELLLSRKQNQKTEKQVNGLLDILKPYRSQKRSTDCGRAELAEWTTTVAGDLVHRIKLTVQEQLTWVAHIGPTAPPRYSHRLVAVASEILGVEALLDVLADVLKEQTLVGNGSLAIDVCTAMICSSTAATSTSSLPIGGPLRDNRLTLRDALRLRTSNVHELLKLPAGRAEALVRLSRTVEAHLVVPDIPQLAPMAPLLETEAADQVMAELGLTDAGGAEMSDTSRQLEVTAGADFTNDDIAAALNMDQNAMDLSGAQNQGTVDLGANDNSMQDQSQDLFADLNMDLSQSVPNPDGSTQNKEDDIFAGLNMDFGGDDFDFS